MPCALMICKINFDANSMYKFRVFATFSESFDRIVMHLFHYQALLIFFLRTEISVIVLKKKKEFPDFARMLRSTFKRRVKRDRARGKCTLHFWRQPYLPYAAKPKSNETHEIYRTCVCCVAVQPHSTWAPDQNGVRMIAVGCWIYFFCTHHDKHNRFT